ncbi:hypothetical protein BJF84_27700 [Rhodococcus sp. CUA-806]|nr:hypothetical protein BJF84_27700 [Rhodococcus sp. CUA-806]
MGRHDYVPRTYLRDGGGRQNRRIWNLDTVTGGVRAFSVNDVSVDENFYGVVLSDGRAHNRVESMFAVEDTELGRVQALFENPQDSDELEFDDLIGLGVTAAVRGANCSTTSPLTTA